MSSYNDRRWLTCLLLALLGTSPPGVYAEEPAAELGLAAPPGFGVSLYAGDDLAHDIFSMTLDSQGRVVVAGPNYVKTLHDDDGDGRADRAALFSETPASGAHGMCFDGPDLICTGDNSIGRLRDANGDGEADGPLEVWARLKHSEHGGNGIVHGPDGWFYVIAGNDAGVSEDHVRLPGSPVRHPRCGAVVRFSPDGKQSQVVAHGFRNPYDLDFCWQGQLFTVDADGERDHHLPWYAPNRLFDIAAGQEHGWLLQGFQRSWNRPEAFFDNVERLVEIGRGSPTGLACYRHRQFPQHYRDGVFSACWTQGKVYYFPLTPRDASYQSQLEVFLQTTGDVGFAPVDLAVGPTGDLFVAIGGRGTRGSVFRVSYVGDENTAAEKPSNDLACVLAADQPLASWSRRHWVPLAKNLGQQPFVKAAQNRQLPIKQRVRAVEVLIELFDGIPANEDLSMLGQYDEVFADRVAWALGRQPNEAAHRVLPLLTHEAPAAARAAWEAVAAIPNFTADRAVPLNWTGALDSSHRRVRQAAILAARQGAAAEYAQWKAEQKERTHRQRLSDLWIHGPLAEAPLDAASRALFVEESLAVFAKSTDLDIQPEAVQLEAVRLLQIALGDLHLQPDQPEVYSGYTGNETEQASAAGRSRIVDLVAPEFPTGDAALDREMARLLGMLAADRPGLPAAIASRSTDSTPLVDDIHYLIVLSRLPGERSPDVTRQTAEALARLHHKLADQQLFPSRNWPNRLGECFDELCHRDPALPRALVENELFTRPEQSLFAARMDDSSRALAARKLLAAATAAEDAGEDNPWTSELVSVVAALPDDEALPALREHWDDYALRDSIALALAARHLPDDRERLFAALDSPQADVISHAAQGLLRLPAAGTAQEIGLVLRTLRQYLPVKQQRDLRQSLASLARHLSDQQLPEKEPAGSDAAAVYQPWFEWFTQAYPDEAQRLAASGTIDLTTWAKRLADVDWAAGDLQRGQAVYEKRACHRCHRGSSRLGPDLNAAAKRLARDDLFTAIVDPNKEVSALYQTQVVATRSGQVYNGLVVYESPNGTLLQTGPDTTVRISAEEFLSMQPSRQSIMPVGLLNNANDQDLADLYAYLKSLTPTRQ
ncbi:MAG: hypothetical protein AB7O62_17715 [Pirellulales bacterium]